MGLIIESINRNHIRTNFDCGYPELNVFLARYARQNDKANFNKTYVCIREGSKSVLGYYVLATSSIEATTLPKHLNHPYYPVSCVKICRLAVTKSAQGKGVGKLLLASSFRRILEASKMIGIFLIIVEAKDVKAKDYYEQYGFESIINNDLTLILPIKTIKNALK